MPLPDGVCSPMFISCPDCSAQELRVLRNDPEFMAQCKQGIADAKAGRVKLWADVKKELSIAQPELRELPLEKSISLKLDEIFSGKHRVIYNCGAVDAYLTSATINDLIKAILPIFQQAKKDSYKKGVEDNYNMGQIDLEQALKRIAELEADRNAYNSAYYSTLAKKEELEAEIASLKEQLAVFTKTIPKGSFCEIGADECYCRFVMGECCLLVGRELHFDKKAGEYLKAPGCPVPAEEEK